MLKKKIIQKGKSHCLWGGKWEEVSSMLNNCSENICVRTDSWEASQGQWDSWDFALSKLH